MKRCLIKNGHDRERPTSAVRKNGGIVRFDAYLASMPLLHTFDGGKSWNTGGFVDYQLAPFQAGTPFELWAIACSLAAITGVASVAVVPAILGPFPDVTLHVVKPP
jgi:hypothetical protein